METIKFIIDLMDKVTIVVSFLTLFFVFKNWLNDKKKLDKIDIFFNDKKLNLDIVRKDVTRQEIQGILGILRKNMTKNYHIDYLSTIDFLDNIYKIQKNELDKLVIKITDEELKQFKDDIFI